MLTSRTPKVTGGSQRRSTTRSRSSGPSPSSIVFVRASTFVQVAEQDVGTFGLRGAHLARAVAVAGVRRVGLESATPGPLPTCPDLLGPDELGDVVVLAPG